jgi:hypothetical protein
MARYYHRIVVWDKQWKVVYTSDDFSFMTGMIEFSCGMAEYKDNILVTFGYEDNAAYLLTIPKEYFLKLCKLN